MGNIDHVIYYQGKQGGAYPNISSARYLQLERGIERERVLFVYGNIQDFIYVEKKQKEEEGKMSGGNGTKAERWENLIIESDFLVGHFSKGVSSFYHPAIILAHFLKFSNFYYYPYGFKIKGSSIISSTLH